MADSFVREIHALCTKMNLSHMTMIRRKVGVDRISNLEGQSTRNLKYFRKRDYDRVRKRNDGLLIQNNDCPTITKIDVIQSIKEGKWDELHGPAKDNVP